MEIIFMRAEIVDASKLIEVQNMSFADDFEKYGECPAYNETEENMLDMIRNVIVYKIIGNEEIIGNVILRNRGNGEYYLKIIAVIPSYQNLGIGTKAIKFIENDNKQVTDWSLITPEQNYRNRHFYEKLGYTKFGEDKHSERLTLIKYKKKADRL